MIFILPQVAQADSLDEFKNILASKHFFIKYTYHREGDAYNQPTGAGVFLNDKNNAQIMNQQNFNVPRIGIEAYDGNNFYTEYGAQPNSNSSKGKKASRPDSMMRPPTISHLKLGDKLFFLMERMQKSKTAHYQEGYIYSTALSPEVIALFNKTEGIKTIIEVEEFNTNPAPKYFKLPANFKKIEKAPAMVRGNV